MDNSTPIKLHLGCGTKIIEGFINIDVRLLPGVDIVSSIESLPMFEDNSVDLIYCCHVLEHFPRNNVQQILQEWYRILKPTGILRISVPNFEAVVTHYNIHNNLQKLLGLLYGGQTYKENFHYNIWDYKTMKTFLESIGFNSIKYYDWRLTEHANIDDFSQAYLPHMDKENGVLMSLNIECIKPIH